jgi:hypothetical protein
MTTSYLLWYEIHKLLNFIRVKEVNITFIMQDGSESCTQLKISRKEWNEFLNLLVTMNIQTEYGLSHLRGNVNKFCIHYNYFRYLWTYLIKSNFTGWDTLIFYY